MDNGLGVITSPPSPFKVLLLREIHEAFASRRFWIILSLCLVLIPLGVEVSIRDYQTRLQGYRESVRLYNEEVKTIGDILFKDGAKAYFPPSPMSFLSLGLELDLPNVAESQFKNSQPPAAVRFDNSQGIDNIYEFFFGPLDLVFMVGVVLSFLTIILTFGSIAGEKEKGTLKLVLSNSVPKAQVLLAKAAANGFLLIAPFILSLVLTVMVLRLRGIPLFTVGASTSIAMSILVSVLLIGAFLNLGLLVSALTKQAVSALVILLIAWVFLYGIFPRLSASAAEAIIPVESDAQIDFEKAQIRTNIYRERDAEIDRLLLSAGKAAKPGQSANPQEEIQSRYQTKLEETWTALDRDVHERQKRQFAIAAALSRLSPVSCFIRPMSELGRTGWLEYENYLASARRYEAVLNRDIFSKQKWMRTGRGVAGWSEANFKAAVPVFVYVPIPTEDIMRNILPDVFLLVIFNLLFFSGAFVSFLRYDAR